MDGNRRLFMANSSVSRIDTINAAISAHTAWRQRFYDLIESELELNPLQVGQTNICKFGKWLEEEGKGLLTRENYDALRKLHTQFHQTAAKVVKFKKAGNRAQVQASLKLDGEFSQTSTQLINYLVAIREKMQPPQKKD
jgi:Chemoreceptor zinc-binding domain